MSNYYNQDTLLDLQRENTELKEKLFSMTSSAREYKQLWKEAGEERNNLRSKLAAMEAEKSAVAVPDGWKLVPIEPTTQQLYAAESPIDGVISCRQSSQHAIADAAYRAMLASAPSHSQQSAEYRCHKCGTETPPPEPFKAYVKCACGTLTAATAALADDRCPSHESEQL